MAAMVAACHEVDVCKARRASSAAGIVQTGDGRRDGESVMDG
jgi:hypothetical protein